jgi:hypothetical protein
MITIGKRRERRLTIIEVKWQWNMGFWLLCELLRLIAVGNYGRSSRSYEKCKKKI